jgi:DNA-3-methyladenine glycosylase II
MPAVPESYRKAQRHLARRDQVLKELIRDLGPCTLVHVPDGFATLVRSIISQQISTKAAMSIGSRLLTATGKAGFSPRGILKLPDAKLRAAGLSAAKARAIRDLAEKVQSGQVPLDNLPTMPDEDAIDSLVQVWGIGRWTAEMYLIFSLGRLDVLPLTDLGLRVGVQRRYKLDELPDKSELVELAEPWRPYRTVATWYFWRSLGNVPQSD